MDTDDAFAEGLDAFGRGLAPDDCPYPIGDDRREVWLDGWDEAKEADELDDDRLG